LALGFRISVFVFGGILQPPQGLRNIRAPGRSWKILEDLGWKLETGILWHGSLVFQIRGDEDKPVKG
jgi:hypothetical protein